MVITSITTHYKRQFDLGNFQNVWFGIDVSANLEGGEQPEIVIDELMKKARQAVKDQAIPIIRANRNEVEHAFLSLPEEQQELIMDYAYNGGNENE